MVQNFTMMECFHSFIELELYHKVIFTFSTILIFLAGTGLNSYVLHSVRIHTTLQTYANGFVVNLCIADQLSIVSLVGLTTGWITRHQTLQTIFETMFCLSYDTTMVMITAIAVDRFASLKYSLNYSSRMTGTKAAIVSVFCWVYSLLVSSLPFVFQWIPVLSSNDCNTTTAIKNNGFAFSVCLLYSPCLIITLISYLKIFAIARYHSRAITVVDRSVSYNYPDHRIQRNTKYLRTLSQVLGPLLILTLPWKICMISNSDVKSHSYLLIVASINCVVNPWVYAYNRSEFQNALRPPTPVRSEEMLRRGEEIANAISSIFGQENYEDQFPSPDETKKTDKGKNGDDPDTVNDNRSWADFTTRQNAKVSVTLHDDNGEMQLTIEDLECSTSRPSLQLSVENFGRKNSRITLSRQYSAPEESFKEGHNTLKVSSHSFSEDQKRKSDLGRSQLFGDTTKEKAETLSV